MLCFAAWAACGMPATSAPKSANSTPAPPSDEQKALSEPSLFPGHGRRTPRYDLPSDDTARVIVRAYESASISSELNARITQLPQREGDRFRKGDVIVAFDCRRIDAEYDAIQAALKAFEADYKNQLRLLDYKAAGTAVVEQALQQREKAAAELRGAAAKLDSCRIVAPFDGRVTEKMAQMHEIAQPNQPLIKIINEAKLELVLMMPSSWIAQINDHTLLSVRIDETGEQYRARVVQTTGLIDPVSQSVRVIAELAEETHTVLPGMSGTATFPQHRAEQ